MCKWNHLRRTLSVTHTHPYTCILVRAFIDIMYKTTTPRPDFAFRRHILVPGLCVYEKIHTRAQTHAHTEPVFSSSHLRTLLLSMCVCMASAAQVAGFNSPLHFLPRPDLKWFKLRFTGSVPREMWGARCHMQQ